MKGLIIRSPWIELILNGQKTWEMRSRPVNIRGKIGLIRGGSGTIVGEAELVDCMAPLTREQMLANVDMHGIPLSEIDKVMEYGWTTPWVLARVNKYPKPLPYAHPNGAVTWVELNKQPDAPHAAEDMTQEQPGATTVIENAATDALPKRASQTGDTTARVDIPLTQGNLNNNHFYLRAASRLLSADCIGGSNKQKAAARMINVTFTTGEAIQTDVDGTKMILRDRGAVGAFLRHSRAKSGDLVRFTRVGPYSFEVALVRNQTSGTNSL